MKLAAMATALVSVPSLSAPATSPIRAYIQAELGSGAVRSVAITVSLWSSSRRGVLVDGAMASVTGIHFPSSATVWTMFSNSTSMSGWRCFRNR